MSLVCQSSFGPTFGHSFNKPVSLEMPSRCGPRHCGQSSAEAASVKMLTQVAARKNEQFFIFHLNGLENVARQPCRGNCSPFVRWTQRFCGPLAERRQSRINKGRARLLPSLGDRL